MDIEGYPLPFGPFSLLGLRIIYLHGKYAMKQTPFGILRLSLGAMLIVSFKLNVAKAITNPFAFSQLRYFQSGNSIPPIS